MDPPGARNPGTQRVKHEGDKQSSVRNSSDSWHVGWGVIYGATHEHRDGAHVFTGQELGRKLDAVSVERRNINYNTGGYVVGDEGIEFAGGKETLLHRIVKAHRDASLPTELATAYIEELLARGADVTLEDEANKTAAQLDAERCLSGWPYFPMLVPGDDADSVQKIGNPPPPRPFGTLPPPPSATGRKAPTDRFVDAFGDFLDHLELQLEELQRMEQQATADALGKFLCRRQAQDMHRPTMSEAPAAAGLDLSRRPSQVVRFRETEEAAAQSAARSPPEHAGPMSSPPRPSPNDERRASAVADDDATAPPPHDVDRSGNSFTISVLDDGASDEIVVKLADREIALAHKRSMHAAVVGLDDCSC